MLSSPKVSFSIHLVFRTRLLDTFVQQPDYKFKIHLSFKVSPTTHYTMEVLLFGDQTADQYALLHRATHTKDNAVLTTFLERVSVALREETRKLPRSRREQIPDFLRVNDLLEHYYEKGTKIPELESSLVTVAQLAHYIG